MLKIILKILDIVSTSSLALPIFDATTNMAPMGVLSILGNEYIIGVPFIKFCKVYIKPFTKIDIFLNYFSDGCLAFKYVRDFELERITSFKTLGRCNTFLQIMSNCSWLKQQIACEAFLDVI